ncbi:DNA_mis_repair domain-containing protein [Psidium guajava]|nr:DNA_mis_repair domain-containing protein [Psidium guajava]
MALSANGIDRTTEPPLAARGGDKTQRNDIGLWGLRTIRKAMASYGVRRRRCLHGRGEFQEGDRSKYGRDAPGPSRIAIFDLSRSQFHLRDAPVRPWLIVRQSESATVAFHGHLRANLANLVNSYH